MDEYQWQWKSELEWQSESEWHWDKYKSVRDEVIQGCQLVKELESQLNENEKEKENVNVKGGDMYELILRSSAQIVTIFSKALDRLNCNCNSSWHEGEMRKRKCKCGSPTATPTSRSGGRSSVSGSPPTPAASEYMSEDSPHGKCRGRATANVKAEDPENEKEKEIENESILFSASASPGSKERREISRKRKSLPRRTIRIPANNSEPGNDVPPDDGYTWRKYGQKDILGAQHPRSYYRCTHKNDLGCQATKQVQRADDDPSFFEITYRGAHTCQMDHRILQIQLPFPLGSTTNSSSGTSNTLVFGPDCNLQSKTCTGLGLAPTQLHASSSHAPTPWFGSDACKMENERPDGFGKSPAASTMFSYLHNLLPIEETSAPITMQSSNRSANISVSLFKNQGHSDQEQNSSEIIPEEQNMGFSAFPEGELGWPNFAQIFSSPATSESNYAPVPTPVMSFMNTNTSGQQLQPSESDLKDVVSGHTSAADSPMLDMDPFSMFSTVNLDSLFQFEKSDPF
uniref:TSA: Wollemia nobilis Ref_Wollemi_Transcript_7171_2278 transcribed RNA sequence n=1 Tax=Wollemia nobilis TaxID=56998 RepID=A0A0C9S9Q1_9CONI